MELNEKINKAGKGLVENWTQQKLSKPVCSHLITRMQV